MPLSKIDSDSLNSPITAVNLAYTGTLTGGTGVVNLGSGQVYKDASGNVGIGTSSPTAKLSVTSASGSDGIRITTADVQYIKFLNNSTKNWGFATTNLAASDFGIYRATSNGGDPISAGTPLLYFDGSGNMMVGKTNSSYDVNGQALLAGGQARFTVADGSPLLLLRNGSNGTLVEFWRGGIGPVGSISTNGSSTAYNTSSDYRLKEDIAPMTGALDKVALLKPITYKWKATGEFTNGFIAHELQAVVPDCVTGEKDAVDADGKPVYQGIDVSFLVATLTAAIQELKAIVDAQGAEIAALKGTP